MATDETTEYVFECGYAYGVGRTQEQALVEMLGHFKPSKVGEDGLKCWWWKVEGYRGGGLGEIDADVVHDEGDMNLPPEKTREAIGQIRDLSVTTETLLIKGEERLEDNNEGGGE